MKTSWKGKQLTSGCRPRLRTRVLTLSSLFSDMSRLSSSWQPPEMTKFMVTWSPEHLRINFRISLQTAALIAEMLIHALHAEWLRSNCESTTKTRNHNNNNMMRRYIWNESYMNCGYEIKWSYDLRSYERNFGNCVEKPEKYRTSTGFKPVTSRFRCDALTNWAMKPLTLGAGHLWVLMVPW